jgi:hypothetical protein
VSHVDGTDKDRIADEIERAGSWAAAQPWSLGPARLRSSTRKRRLKTGSLGLVAGVVGAGAVFGSLVLGGIITTAPVTTASGTRIVRAETTGCVPAKADVVAQSKEWVRVWTDQHLTVGPGTYVGAQVTEPAYTEQVPGQIPSEFPWGTAELSRVGVLVPAIECPSSPETSLLASAVYYYRANNVGTVIVTVPLKRLWYMHFHCSQSSPTCEGLAPLRVMVTVK